MAQGKYVSPEKQLLNLIENPKGNKIKSATYAVKHRGVSIFSLSGWSGRIASIGKLFSRKSQRQLDIKTVNNLLSFLIFVLMLYFGTSFFGDISNLKNAEHLNIKVPENVKRDSFKKIEGFKKPASFYLGKVRTRNIFRMGGWAKEEPVEEGKVVSVDSKLPSSRILTLSQNYKLVGISWSDDPDVMIEDTRALKTFFVKRGQLIGALKVEAIFKDRVILSYEGEEVELR